MSSSKDPRTKLGYDTRQQQKLYVLVKDMFKQRYNSLVQKMYDWYIKHHRMTSLILQWDLSIMTISFIFTLETIYFKFGVAEVGKFTLLEAQSTPEDIKDHVLLNLWGIFHSPPWGKPYIALNWENNTA